MLNHKMILYITVILCLSACAAPLDITNDGLEKVVTDGLLITPNAQSVQDAEYPKAEVIIDSIIRPSDLAVRTEGAFQRDLRFERDGGRLYKLHVQQRDAVKKDDILAEIIFDNEALETERKELLLTINQFEQQYESENMSWLNRLDRAREVTDDMDENFWEIHQLTHMKMELEYEKFQFLRDMTRRDYHKDLEEIEEKLAGEQILAPFDGVISYVFNGRVDSLVRPWQRIVTVVDDTSIYFAITAPKDVVRYGDIIPVTDRSGDISFNVKVVSDPVSPLLPENAYTFWLMPADHENFAALAESLELTTSALRSLSLSAAPIAMAARNVLVVPRRAVYPEDKKSFVYIYEDDIIKKRYVKTGLSFADEIQIIDGLEAGQLVVLMS